MPLSALLLFTTLSAHPVFASEPQVKKSKTNICHPKGGRYYHKTKNYTPYNSMEACIQSGGRAAKR
ncbi:hypothetical protein B6S09_08860 [Oceanimonas baumannii]|uniref:Uncharacterized protein n=1 Tax=Oceanimonas baumannii TaxID=129578 RepID=A0A235CL63_9GAMM|nr:hypothetical protein B6S09_08860 [Oceanimonas baumannii]